MKNSTKIVLGVVVVVVLVLVGIALYFFFFANKGPGVVVDTGANPFGEGGDFFGGGEDPGPTPTDTGSGREVAPNLFLITEGPVAFGSTVLSVAKAITIEERNDSTTATSSKTIHIPQVRYVERQSGNVYSYDVNERVLTRLSNRTLPGIQEASWTFDGTTAFLRFLSATANGGESIATYALPVENEDAGFVLENGLDQIVVSGTSTIITLLPSTSGSIATIAHTDGTGAKTLFSSTMSSLRIYPAGKGVAAYTKASSQSNGFAFMVSSAGVFDRILGPLRGLTILPSPSGKSILYSFLSGQTVTSGVMDTAKRTVTSLPLAILPEKCVWTTNEKSVYCGVPRTIATNVWPDSWYQGVVTFSDRIWNVDFESGSAILVVDPVAVASAPIDAVSLAIDPRSDVLIFTNKKDGSLWAYDL